MIIPSNALGINYGINVLDVNNPSNNDYLPQMSISISDDTMDRAANIAGAKEAVLEATEAAALAMYNSLAISFPSPDYELDGRFSYHQITITADDDWPAA